MDQTSIEIAWRNEPDWTDREHVRRLTESTGVFYPFEIDVAVELVEERLRRGPASGYEFLFACDGVFPVGYACFGPISMTQGSFDLYWIAVAKDRQGFGIGRRLLNECEQSIVKKGGRRLYIETSGRDVYAPTRRFYLSCGYAVAAVLDDFYAAGDAKYIFVKSLSAERPLSVLP